jgi:hypothetical protein
MWYLYLDESGDLGFDFTNRGPSHFFTICILVINQRESFKKIQKGVKKTLFRKLNKSQKKSRIYEVKGNSTSIEVKKYFWKQIKDCKFEIYAVTLNKKRVYKNHTQKKERIYNYIAHQVIDQIPFEKISTRLQIVADKRKAKTQILEFNDYLFRQLEGKINPKIPINIDHSSSHQDFVLQAVDLFAWGIFRKYERKDTEWYDMFRGKVCCDKQYL